MTQMLNIIKNVDELRNSSYMSERDEPKILELYKTVYEVANDKNSYEEKSTAMLNALSENRLSEEEKQQWLSYAGSISSFR